MLDLYGRFFNHGFDENISWRDPVPAVSQCLLTIALAVDLFIPARAQAAPPTWIWANPIPNGK